MQVLERQGQLEGKRYVMVGHWTEEEEKAGRRQRYQLGDASGRDQQTEMLHEDVPTVK